MLNALKAQIRSQTTDSSGPKNASKSLRCSLECLKFLAYLPSTLQPMVLRAANLHFLADPSSWADSTREASLINNR